MRPAVNPGMNPAEEVSAPPNAEARPMPRARRLHRQRPARPSPWLQDAHLWRQRQSFSLSGAAPQSRRVEAAGPQGSPLSRRLALSEEEDLSIQGCAPYVKHSFRGRHMSAAS